MKKLMFVILATLVASQALAQEQDKKGYVFVQAGSASVDINKSGNDQALIGAGAIGLNSTVNDTAGAVLIGAGFRFVPQASVEVGYLKVADYTYKATFAQGSATETISGSGIGVNLVGYLPLAERVTLYGKLGIWSMDVDDNVTISAAGFAQAHASSSNTTPMIGIGLDVKIVDNVSVRVEYDHWNKVGDDSTIGSSKLNFVSGGLAVAF